VRGQEDYAAAHAILADACATLAFRESVSERGLIDRARGAAIRALELDDRLADAHATLAWIRFFDGWDARAAEAGLARALQIDPSAARTLSWLSQTLMAVGRHDAAIDAARRALDAEPLSYRLSTTLALVLYNARRFDEAAAQARRALDLAPDDFLAHTALGLSSLQAGRADAARAALQASLAALPDSTETMAYLAYVDARTGAVARARASLAGLEQPPGGRPPAPAYQRALVHAALGDADRALACLDEAIRQHETDLPYLGVDPLFDPIRADSRFAALVARIGIHGR
jgi:tetratricopeptide (TPR) repeat protein